eukprot:5215988-Alexandrium_andersonii.AAC.1
MLATPTDACPSTLAAPSRSWASWLIGATALGQLQLRRQLPGVWRRWCSASALLMWIGTSCSRAARMSLSGLQSWAQTAFLCQWMGRQCLQPTFRRYSARAWLSGGVSKHPAQCRAMWFLWTGC